MGKHEAELKPCPFCRRGGIVIHPLPPGAKGLHLLVSRAPYYAHCDGCGADGPPGDTEAEAIANWNTRTTPSPDSTVEVGELVERLRRLADRLVTADDHRISRTGAKEELGALAELAALDRTRERQVDQVERVARAVMTWGQPHFKHIVSFNVLCEAIASAMPMGEEARLREALQDLRTWAAVLHQNAVGCATNHYGEDFALHGEPGWLRDAGASIDRAHAALSHGVKSDG